MNWISWAISMTMIGLCGLQASLIAMNPSPIIIGSAVVTFGFTAFTIMNQVKR